MNDRRGSIWRKWDLHIHTPDSYYQQFGEDWDEYVRNMKAKAVEHDIEVAIVNDYFSINGYSKIVNDYCEEKGSHPSLALPNGKRLYVLPGVELRLSVFDRDEDAVNIHVVFDPTILPDTIRSSFIERLTIKYGHRKLYCKHEDLIKIGNAIDNAGKFEENLDLLTISEQNSRRLIKKACSVITLDVDDLDQGLKRLEESLALFEKSVFLKIIANKGHGSLAGFDWYTLNLQEGRAGNIRRTMLSATDICFSNSQSDRSFLLGATPQTPVKEIIDRFRTIKPCVWGSDAHTKEVLFHPSNGGSLDYTWIKADPTFEGLRQLLFEPSSRVFIGITPEKLLDIDEAKHQYIDSIHIEAKSNNAEWFDTVGSIPLNPGLVSIIGNKGAGKSALADMIASAGNCENDSYSFLSVDRFLKLDQHRKYVSSIQFLDGAIDKKPFSASEFDQRIPAKVVYLSQSFVRDLCESDDVSRLQNEIHRVLGSHIPEEDRGGLDNLTDIISARTTLYDNLITELTSRLQSLNREIIKYESYGKSSFRKTKHDRLLERQKELTEVEVNFKRLESVPAPKNNDNLSIANEVTEYRKKIQALEKQAKENQESLNLTVLETTQIDSLIAEINIALQRHSSFVSTLTNNSLLNKYGIATSDLVSFSSNIAPLSALRESLASKTTLFREEKTKIDSMIAETSRNIKEREALLGTRERKYQEYQTRKRQYDSRKKEIEGDKNTADSIVHLQAWIDFIDKHLNKELSRRYSDRKQLLLQISENLVNKRDALKSLFSYGQSQATAIARKANLPESEILTFDISLQFDHGFDDYFLNMVSQNRIGTFYGKDSGLKELKKLKNTISLGDINSISNFPESIISALKYDLRKDDSERVLVDIEQQLVDGINLDQLYNFIFGLDYLAITVEITHKDRQLENLSPGEKGTLLLIFYLLLDKDRRPLIIDQPEENLDNETIFKVLVPLINQAKQQRQIVIVTHNPNLAVVCDSEQIIHATMDKENRCLVGYDSGSIEKSTIREDTINILEGTKAAFANRQGKYHISNI